MDNYLPSIKDRIFTVSEQIEECKRIIYRNNIENLLFTVNNEKAKQKEVAYNNETLKEKIDVLVKELESLNASSGSLTE